MRVDHRAVTARTAATCWSAFALVCVLVGLWLVGGWSVVSFGGVGVGSVRDVSLPVGSLGVVSRALGGDERAFGVARVAGGGLVARGGGVVSEFFKRGVVVSDGADPVLWLGLSAIGRSGGLRPVGLVAPAARGSRVSYRRGGLVEWYRNGPLGLEQGFTIRHRPAGSGMLRLAVGSVARGTHASVHGDRASLAFTGSAGEDSWSYGNLAVTDGRHVRVRCEGHDRH